MRTKKTKRDLNRLRALATAPPLWVPTPAWFIGGGVDILLPDDGVDLAPITKAVYVAAIKEAVAARELTKEYLEAEQQERSWARFVAWREGDHGPHIDAPKQPTPPQSIGSTLVESYGSEGGPRQRRDLEAERADDERELERQRLLRIANEAGVRWFTS
jgi:hypothetical protein